MSKVANPGSEELARVSQKVVATNILILNWNFLPTKYRNNQCWDNSN